MGGKGDNKHSFSSERIYNVMSLFIKLLTHINIGHNIRKDTDNNATLNNTRNENRIDISAKARKCTWRNTNNDTRNICVMLHAIKPYPQMMSAILPTMMPPIIHVQYPLRCSQQLFTIVPENYTQKGSAIMRTIIPTIIFTNFSAIVPAITHTYIRKDTCNNTNNTHKCFCNGIRNSIPDEGYPIGYP